MKLFVITAVIKGNINIGVYATIATHFERAHTPECVHTHICWDNTFNWYNKLTKIIDCYYFKIQWLLSTITLTELSTIIIMNAISISQTF